MSECSRNLIILTRVNDRVGRILAGIFLHCLTPACTHNGSKNYTKNCSGTDLVRLRQCRSLVDSYYVGSDPDRFVLYAYMYKRTKHYVA